MSNGIAALAKKTNNECASVTKSDENALHLRYRQIGISAVAAAARYQGGAKNTAYAPADVGADAYRKAVA